MQEDCEAYLSELTAMGEVNEKSEAEVARLIKQQRERDDQVGLWHVWCLVCAVFRMLQ